MFFKALSPFLSLHLIVTVEMNVIPEPARIVIVLVNSLQLNIGWWECFSKNMSYMSKCEMQRSILVSSQIKSRLVWWKKTSHFFSGVAITGCMQ